MKSPWSARDSERLAWKALDLAVDAVTSLHWIRDLLVVEIFAETQPPQIKARKSAGRRKRRLKP
jgi:hypothetical protein